MTYFTRTLREALGKDAAVTPELLGNPSFGHHMAPSSPPSLWPVISLYTVQWICVLGTELKLSLRQGPWND